MSRWGKRRHWSISWGTSISPTPWLGKCIHGRRCSTPSSSLGKPKKRWTRFGKAAMKYDFFLIYFWKSSNIITLAINFPVSPIEHTPKIQNHLKLSFLSFQNQSIQAACVYIPRMRLVVTFFILKPYSYWLVNEI